MLNKKIKIDNKTLIEIIAYIWIKCGRNKEDFDWLVGGIRKKIEEMINIK